MMDDWETLDLSSNDPCRTALIHRDTKIICFTAKTEDKQTGSKPLTTFADEQGNVIARLEWHLYLSDKLSIHEEKMVGVGKWLKSRKGVKDAVAFTCTSGNQYYWKCENQSSTLWLYSESNNQSALGAFQPRGKKALISDPPPLFPSLHLSHLLKADRDEIIVALLLIEKSRRFGKKLLGSPIGDSFYSSGSVIPLVGTF